MLRAAAATEAPPVASTSKPGPIIMDGQILHSLPPKRLELVNGMSDYVEQQVYPLLKPVDKCWQPYDFLPRSEDADFMDKVRGRRRRRGARAEQRQRPRSTRKRASPRRRRRAVAGGSARAPSRKALPRDLAAASPRSKKKEGLTNKHNRQNNQNR